MSLQRLTYRNFVRASSPKFVEVEQAPISIPFLRGEDAKRLYLEEVKDVKINNCVTTENASKTDSNHEHPITTNKISTGPISDKDLFVAVQNSDIETLHQALNQNPEKLHILDDFGWSLLMIACQANSIQIVKELLRRGADVSIRDKAGNSARSLVIKNKNIELATLLLDNSKASVQKRKDHKKKRHKEKFTCDICGKTFPDKQEHLASTVHNISASKGKKITSSYQIPETNKGFQIMLKTGWDKDSGLGASGEGRRYPIRPVEKKDRKGLGLKKKILEQDKNEILINKKLKNTHKSNQIKNKNMEINFRREFY